MLIKVKDLNKLSYDLDIDNTITIEEFSNLIRSKFNYTNSIKVIYKGKVLCPTDIVGNVIENNSFVICLENKQEKEETYNLRQVKAVVLATLRLFKTEPRLNYLFITNDIIINEIISSSEFDKPLKELLDQSNDIAESMENKRNFNISITPISLPQSQEIQIPTSSAPPFYSPPVDINSSKK
jgi:hypothetical protein